MLCTVLIFFFWPLCVAVSSPERARRSNFGGVVVFNASRMCNLQANTGTLTSYFEEVVLGSISIQVLERRVAYFTFACPVAMAGKGCQLVIVQPKRGIR